MSAAFEELVKTLNNGEPAKRCPTLRITEDHDHALNRVLVRWSLDLGWRDPATGDPA